MEPDADNPDIALPDNMQPIGIEVIDPPIPQLELRTQNVDPNTVTTIDEDFIQLPYNFDTTPRREVRRLSNQSQ